MEAIDYEKFLELVRTARSVRRFDQSRPVGREQLLQLVELARLGPCSANLQTLRFCPCHRPEHCRRVFATLKWAGYLADWPGPAEGERPVAYILVLHDRRRGQAREVDAGIALQNLVLGARALGLGSCILGSVDRPRLIKELGLGEHLQLLYVLALGVAAEQIVLEPAGAGGDLRYWRDEQGRHHVPKLELAELLVEPGTAEGDKT